MDQIVIETSEAPIINIGTINGSLRIKGWDQDKLRADSDKKNSIKISQTKEAIGFDCSSGCLLRVPSQSIIKIQQVSNDLMAKSLEGNLTVTNVNGQIIVKNISSISVSTANSNVSAKQVEGDLKIQKVVGNLSISNVEGFIEIGNCSSNTTIRGFSKGIKAKSNGNATLRLELDPIGKYEISANGNITCRVESDSSAKVGLRSGSKSINVRTPEFKEILSEEEYNFEIGEGESQISLDATGNVVFRFQSPSDDFSYDFGIEEEFETFADDISQQISDQIEFQIGSLTEQIDNMLASTVSMGIGVSDRTRRNLEAKRRSLERKLAKKQQRFERKARSAATRVRTHRSYVRQTSDPVSEEEQKMILEMLQNNQISIEDAEVLLAALEGKIVEASTLGAELDNNQEIEPEAVEEVKPIVETGNEENENLEK